MLFCTKAHFFLNSFVCIRMSDLSTRSEPLTNLINSQPYDTGDLPSFGICYVFEIIRQCLRITLYQ